MRRAMVIIVIGVVLLAAAFAARVYVFTPKPQMVVLTLPPTPSDVLTVSGLHPPVVKPEWREKMLAYEDKAHWLDTSTWVGNKSWQVPLVSTGRWGTIAITLNNGQQFQADILYTLQLNVMRQVVMVPLVMGVKYQDDYVAWPHYVSAGQLANDNLSRSQFLQIAKQQFPLGHALLAFAYSPWATPRGLDWQSCNAGKAKIPKWTCTLGQAIEQQWPGYTALVLRRVLQPQQIPHNFFLYGVMPWSLDTDTHELDTWEVKR